MRATWDLSRCAAALLVLASFTVGCSRTPQLGGDEDCMAAADALWTGVTSKRVELVDRSSDAIERLHAAGQLNDEAFEVLHDVAVTARGGAWSDARRSLKTFIVNQRPRQ